DTYYVAQLGDQVIEQAHEGNDKVISSLSYTLPDNVENLELTGTANLLGYRNSLSNKLIGNSGANQLVGYDGDDLLDGREGADVMIGGAGDDSYFLDTQGYRVVVGTGIFAHYEYVPGDQVIEKTDEGNDTVNVSFSYQLGDNLENLR